MLSRKEFLTKAKELYGNKFDYTQMHYISPHKKVTIKCNTCGRVFEQKPYDHLKNDEPCRACSYKKRGKAKSKPFSQLIKEFEAIHNGKYSYENAEPYYKNNKTLIPITCSKHGEFWQSITKHLSGRGCPKCAIENRAMHDRLPFEEFVRRANEKHNNFYIYDKTKENYAGVHKMGIITCPIHGDFQQILLAHYKGQGCPKCGTIKTATKKKIPFETFKKNAEATHGVGTFIYSKETYVDYTTKTLITCAKCGRSFWQIPYSHVYGNGCLNCAESKLEMKVEGLLKDLKVDYIKEKRFDWLRYKRKMRLDFFLPQLNTAIECQGHQHFRPVDFAGKGEEWAEKQFALNLEKDKLKKQLCEEHNVNLIYCNYDDDFSEFSNNITKLLQQKSED